MLDRPRRVQRVRVAGGGGCNHDVLWTERIPRTLLGPAVGASLGASGLVMQALTMNPLSDPGILGVEQGAAMFVVLGILFLDVNDASGFFWLALVGSAIAAGWSRILTVSSAEMSRAP